MIQNRPTNPSLRVRLFGVALGATCTAIFSGVADAAVANNMVVPGSICQRSSQGDVVVYNTSGWVTADADSLIAYESVTCPIIRDRPNQDMTNLWVRQREIGGLGMICWVDAFSVSGETFDTELPVNGYPLANTYFSQHFDFDNFDHPDNGSYVVRCNLGEGDSVISIRWEEL